MAYRAVTLDNFGGLDLRSDPEDATPVRAIDMLNVDLEKSGRVKSRPGTTKITSKSTTTTWNSLITWVGGGTTNPQVLTIRPSTGVVEATNASTGAAVASTTVSGADLPARITCSTMFGPPTSTTGILYFNADGGDYLYKYDGTSFSGVVAVSGAAKHMAVQLPENRLVLANTGTATYASRVVFSAPQDPETFDLVNDYIDLMPGDGEEIVGLANWGNYLFAFKQSTFFRFYGNQTDADGGTIFAYDFQKHNLQTPAASNKICVAGREGVYFICKDGIYLTTGGPPRKVSAPLDPLFRGVDETGFFASRTASAAIGGGLYPTLGLYYADGKLFLIPGNDSTLFVYDPQINQWTYWEILNSAGMTIYGCTPVLLAGAAREVPAFLMVNAGPSTFESVISRLDPTMVNDERHSSQVGITTTYRTNFMDLGEPGSMKRVRDILVDGFMSTEQINLSVDNAFDYAGLSAYSTNTVTTDPTGSPSAGTWPNYRIGQARVRIANRGTSFSFRITGNQFVLSRAVLHTDAPRPAGVRVQT
jgi:hypothetical protein